MPGGEGRQVKVFYGLGELPARRKGTTATIGNFYAVHRGHQGLIHRVKELASGTSYASTVVTFEPHPQHVLRGEAPVLLVTAERKLELLEREGVRQTVILPFTKELSMVEPEEFIERILVDALRVRALVVGANFRFGHFARGDVTMLRSFGSRAGFRFEAARLAQVGGRSISSTAIRYALSEGDLKWANKALGRSYCLPGRVVRGAGRGRAIGYPTANLAPVRNLCVPAEGIYAGHLLCEGERLPAAISIGTNPTFEESALSIEAHVLNFEGDLYGKAAEFEFNFRMRDHVRFSSADELKAAISEDVAEVRRLVPA